MYFLLFIKKPKGSAPQIFPDTPMDVRDAGIANMIATWEKSKEMFLAKKSLASTKEINIFTMVLEFKDKLEK